MALGHKGVLVTWYWPLGALWSLPGTVLGLLVALVCLPTGIRWDAGVLVVRVHRCIPSMACAQTWGIVVLATADGDRPEILMHERRHTAQWFVLGPLFLLVYPLCSLYAWVRSGNPYQDNALERDARRAAGEDT
jgi:hypothetical protein